MTICTISLNNYAPQHIPEPANSIPRRRVGLPSLIYHNLLICSGVGQIGRYPYLVFFQHQFLGDGGYGDTPDLRF